LKFINLGEKHCEYDFFDDTARDFNEGKPNRIPSYIETAKKHKSQSRKENHA
jgi:hypothetical protein